jgi:hypothetical protein
MDTWQDASAALSGSATIAAAAIKIQTMAIALEGSADIEAESLRIRYSDFHVAGNGNLNVSLIRRIITSSKAKGFGEVIVNADSWRFKGIKANLQSKSELSFFNYWRDIHGYLKSYMPTYYDHFDITKPLRIAYANELVRLNDWIQSILQQNSISTSTWGLDLREKLVQLGANNQSQVKRREKLQSRLAADTFKLENIEKAIEIKCQTTGIPEEYHINVLLTGVRGEPKNIDEIRKIIDDLVPSHLSFNIDYSYLTWGEVKAARLTWGEASQYTAKELSETFLIEVV